MLSSKPCITTCVIDGAAVTLNYYPDTQDLRISDAYGACIYRTKWLAPWTTLHAAMRDLARSRDANRDATASLGFHLPDLSIKTACESHRRGYNPTRNA